MKGQLVMLLLILGVTGCAIKKENTFLSKDHVRTELNLKIHLFDSRKDMLKAIKERYPKAPVDIYGLAAWKSPKDSDKCEIFIYEPRKYFDLNTWGHELAHCVYGKWHLPTS